MHDSDKILSVGALLTQIRSVLFKSPVLNRIRVRGEVSNFREVRGHWYFSLKDDASAIRCIMFQSRVQAASVLLQNGLKIQVGGYVSIYERDGSLAFYVQTVTVDGTGSLWEAFIATRNKLEAEGLFAPERKRALPYFPAIIGVVTSPEGAAYADIRNIVFRRSPNTSLILAGSRVQGPQAPHDLVDKLNRLQKIPGLDLIIIGRGGGSLEELWAFNTEAVVHAVAASKVPVISAVGHETDFTLCDLAADMRAPTPSAAAELAVPVWEEQLQQMGSLENRLRNTMQHYFARKQVALEILWEEKLRRHSLKISDEHRTLLSNKLYCLISCLQKKIQLTREATGIQGARLSSLNPINVLSRGYAICRKCETGEMVTNHNQVIVGEIIDTLLASGYLLCRVENSGDSW